MPSQLVPRSHGLVEAEVLRLAPARDELAEERPGQRLGAAEHEADQHGEREERRELLRGAGSTPITTMTIQTTRPPMIVFLLPSVVAIRPNSSAPPNATNCTSRMVAIRTSVAKPSCFSPYVDDGDDHRLDAVVEEQVGDQEHQGHRVARAARAASSQSWPKLCRTRPPGSATCADRRPVPDPAVRDDGERRPPDRRAEQAEPDRDALARRRTSRAESRAPG